MWSTRPIKLRTNEIAKFIAYKTDPSIRNSITLDTAQYGTDRANALLHAAAEDGNIDVVKRFFEHGVDINGRDANNQTLLHRSKRKPPCRTLAD